MPPVTDSRRNSGSIPATIIPDEVKPFGRYLLFRKLAEGGMAEIFLAKQLGEKGFERNVVIKRMLAHLSAAPDFVDMFLDEARIAAKLAHPNVIQINDFGSVDNRHFICMEYLPGEDFSTVVRTASRQREYVPIAVAVRVIIEAAHGLHFAHTFTDETGNALNIVHRDISPSNIYVTYTGGVKVLDFGIAKAESRITNTTAGVVKGKYMYMSPEQARGNEVDKRSDVFSLGVSLFEALTNTRPFAKDNDLAVLNAVLKNEFPLPRSLRPDLPAELEQVVLKAMHPTLENRYQSAAEFAADLERYLGASTSASGGTQLAGYLKTLFGDERMHNKTTRIPSLASLAAAGASVPGFVEHRSEQPTRAVEIVPVMDAGPRTTVTPSRSDVRAVQPPSSGTGKAIIASVATAAVLLAVGGGYIFWDKQQQKEVPAPVVAVQEPKKDEKPPEVVAPPKEQSGEAVAKVDPPKEHQPNPEADKTDAKPEEETKAVAKTSSKKGVSPKTPLSGPEIQKVVSGRYALMLSCFEKNRAQLGADEGMTQVQFTILGSGTVTNVAVQGALAGQDAGRCLKTQFQALKFRKHPDQEVSLTLPFKWRVQR